MNNTFYTTWNQTCEELNRRGYNARMMPVYKNAQSRDSIHIQLNDTRYLVFYPEDYMTDPSCTTPAAIADNIIQHLHQPDMYRYLEHAPTADDLVSRAYLKSHLMLGIQNHSEEEIIKRSSDLSADFDEYVYLDFQEGATKLPREMLDVIDLTEEELFDFARENTFSQQDIQMHHSEPIAFVSTKDGFLGAAAILDVESLKVFFRPRGARMLAVIPVSVDYCVVYPYKYSPDKRHFQVFRQACSLTYQRLNPFHRLRDKVYLIDLT